MPKARIFISHSTKTLSAKRYLQSVHKAIDGDGRFEVLADTGLKPGDDWRATIYSWMNEAHGAVVLLSKEALESDFVPIELSVLSFMNSRGQKFPLIPVLVDGVKEEDTKRGVIGKIGLSRIQFLEGLGPGPAAAEVIEALRCFFDKNREPRTARELLECQIAQYLRETRLSENEFFEVFDSIGKRSSKRPGGGRRLGDTFLDFAHELLCLSYEDACSVLPPLVKRWSGASPHLIKVLGLIAPFWVEDSEASVIAEVALNEERSKNLLALDVAESWAVKSFVCRACLRGIDTNCILEVGPPDDESEDGVASLKRQLYERLDQVTGKSLLIKPDSKKREHLRGYLKSRRKKNEPMFLVLGRDWALDESLVEVVMEEFSAPTVLFMGTLQEHDLPEDLGLTVPSPTPDREIRAFETYRDTLWDLDFASNG